MGIFVGLFVFLLRGLFVVLQDFFVGFTVGVKHVPVGCAVGAGVWHVTVGCAVDVSVDGATDGIDEG